MVYIRISVTFIHRKLNPRYFKYKKREIMSNVFKSFTKELRHMNTL